MNADNKSRGEAMVCGVLTPARSARGLRRRWRSAFMTMGSALLLAVGGATGTYVAMAGHYRTAANKLGTAISQSSALNAATNNHEGLSHELWQGTPINMPLYHLQERQIEYLFAVALRRLHGPGEHALVSKADRIWRFELVSRGLYGPHAGPRAGGVTAEMQASYGGAQNEVYLLFGTLSDTAIHDAHQDLSSADHFFKLGIGLLAVVFAMVLAIMLYFARRLTSDVVRPVELLQAATHELRAGVLDHRIDLSRSKRPTELEQLADAFNAMAGELLASHTELARRAAVDGLTGLANRATFNDRLATYFDALDRKSQAVTVLFIDVDDFKFVNDTIGHAGGDELLEQIAERLSVCVRGDDFVARLGGDEFAMVILGDRGDEEAADAIAGRVLAEFAEPFVLAGRPLAVTVSIGVSVLRPDTANVASLISQADYAMYSAKRAGKGRHETFEPTSDSITGSEPMPASA
jgi:diguanylate cyclase (GGDEF)-like protein